jgi:HIRAN domain
VPRRSGGTLAIVGESYRQDVLAKVAAQATDAAPYMEDLKGKARSIAQKETDRKWFRAALFRESSNPHDPNAIAVHAAGYGLIGYLDRETALDYAPVFQELQRRGRNIGSCPAMLTGGGPKKSWGVVLCISSPEAVISDLRNT